MNHPLLGIASCVAMFAFGSLHADQADQADQRSYLAPESFASGLEGWEPVGEASFLVDAAVRHDDLNSACIRIQPAGALGYRITGVSMEKVTTERGQQLLERTPSLAAVGLEPGDRLTYPLVTWIKLER